MGVAVVVEKERAASTLLDGASVPATPRDEIRDAVNELRSNLGFFSWKATALSHPQVKAVVSKLAVLLRMQPDAQDFMIQQIGVFFAAIPPEQARLQAEISAVLLAQIPFSGEHDTLAATILSTRVARTEFTETVTSHSSHTAAAAARTRDAFAAPRRQ